jgi:ABC-type sugar transport system permease subunit
MMVWMWTGFYMVLFLAGMEGIPETYYEVARLEGASAWAQFRYITLPLVREIVAVGVVFLVISAMKFFDPIWVLENQRPTKDSHVMTTLLYQKVFTEYNVGYGAAIAVLLFALVFLATLVSLRLSRAERVEY